MTRQGDKTIITQVLNTTNKPVPRFFESDFRDAVIKQGYDVLHERAIKCSCKSRNSEHLSDCKNCGATGWIYVNPTRTRMVVQSMSLNPKYENWGVYGAEVSSITALPEDKLSFMDKVTVLGAISEHSEALHANIWIEGIQEVKYVYTVYDILYVYYLGVFVDSESKLIKLEEGVDFLFSNNKIVFSSEFVFENSSISIRYSHNPSYYIHEMVRDTMKVNILKGRMEEQVLMPIHARAKRIDLFKDRENFTGDRLLDNSFKVCDPPEALKSCAPKIISFPSIDDRPTTPKTRLLTINGVAQTLEEDRTWTVGIIRSVTGNAVNNIDPLNPRINLSQVALTGDYNDLLNIPLMILDFVLTEEKFTWTTGPTTFTLLQTPSEIPFVFLNTLFLDSEFWNLSGNLLTITEVISVDSKIVVRYRYQQ